MADNIQDFIAQSWFTFPQNRSVDTQFSIEKFKSYLNKYGVQHDNLFRVVIAAPGYKSTTGMQYANLYGAAAPDIRLGSGGLDNQELARVLAFYCTDINLPGISLATSDVRRYGVGPTIKMPYAPIFADTTFNFLCDGQGVIHKFFMEWARSIINYSAGKTAFASNTLSARSVYGNPYEVEYKHFYMCPVIVIEVLSKVGQVVETIFMHEAWPINVGEVPMSYASTDQISRLPITFTFRDMEVLPGDNLNLAFGTQPGYIDFWQLGSDAVESIKNASKGLFVPTTPNQNSISGNPAA